MSDEMNWGLHNKEISTTELDQAVKEMVELEVEEEKISELKKEAGKKADVARLKVISMLQQAGKTKYSVDGIGGVSVYQKYSIQTPKDQHSKEQAFNYFKSLGDEVFYRYVGLNSQSLNSFFNQQTEENPEFKIPGIGLPVASTHLRFNKEKK